MKKLFISLPMAGKSEEEIRNKMAEYKENAEYLMGEELELIDSFIDNAPGDIKDVGIWCLGKSITMMADEIKLGGSGFCGKGYKEWVKVSDGGPYIKAKIRLG